jgi:hypothetical protein
MSTYLEQLRHLHDVLVERSFGGVSREQAKLNSSRYLENIDKHIKLLQYQLSRVVSTFNEYHILLTPSAPAAGVDLIEGTPIYMKVDTRGRIPPLKVLVEFKDQAQQQQ